MKTKKLITGVTITYKANEDIKKCISIYDNEITNKPIKVKKV